MLHASLLRNHLQQCALCFPYRPAKAHPLGKIIPLQRILRTTRPPMACNTGKASNILCFKNSISKTVKQEKNGDQYGLSALFSNSNAPSSTFHSSLFTSYFSLFTSHPQLRHLAPISTFFASPIASSVAPVFVSQSRQP